MKHRRTASLKGVVVGALAAVLAAACTENQPTGPNGLSATNDQGTDRSSILTALTCSADISTRQVACGRLGENPLDNPAPGDGPGDKANIIIGGQGVYVLVQTSNAFYDGGTGAFTFDVAIRNLIQQPLGTADTIPPAADPHPDGVRIFVAGGPTVTEGSGTITVVADGVDAFTGIDQPYYQYNTVLDPFEISAPRTWQMNMPNTVTRFSFILLVSAAVPRPDGYIDLQVSNNTATPPTDRQVTWFVRNANGTLAGDQTIMTWSSSDTTLATVNSSGLINPLRAGQAVITAISSDGLRVGYLNLTVKPIRRTWTGAVDNNWSTRGNWMPDNVVPVATDTAVIPDDLTVYPTLTQNQQIGGVEVDDTNIGGTLPSINLGPFYLTASGNVWASGSGEITSSSGRLILAGFAQTVRGNVRNIRVPGRYSLDGNLNVRGGRIEVQSGRLQSTGFRISLSPF